MYVEETIGSPYFIECTTNWTLSPISPPCTIGRGGNCLSTIHLVDIIP